jgi:hypothetical protein
LSRGRARAIVDEGEAEEVANLRARNRRGACCGSTMYLGNLVRPATTPPRHEGVEERVSGGGAGGRGGEGGARRGFGAATGVSGSIAFVHAHFAGWAGRARGDRRRDLPSISTSRKVFVNPSTALRSPPSAGQRIGDRSPPPAFRRPRSRGSAHAAPPAPRGGGVGEGGAAVCVRGWPAGGPVMRGGGGGARNRKEERSVGCKGGGGGGGVGVQLLSRSWGGNRGNVQ